MRGKGPRKIGIPSEDRIYMQVGNFTFRVRQGEFTDDKAEEQTLYTEAGEMGVAPIWLGFTKRKGAFYIELTGMTGEELELFSKGMIAALAAAKEVIEYLDANADTEYDDDTPLIPLRSLRSTPPHIIRAIRPFVGTDQDPTDRKAYDQEFVD